MRNHEIAMLSFARLARISHETPHPGGRDRFLVLAGREACLAGWLDVAERCRDLVLFRNAHHFLSQSDTFPDAMRDESNAGYFANFDSFCSFEQAEHLLSQNDETVIESPDYAGAAAIQELSSLDQPTA
ncbi:MAG: hypothetical protein ACI8P0_003757 [Planctomycetaceae bacterium]